MAANSAGNGPDTVINTTCRSHCGGVCPLKVHVRNGEIVAIEAGEGHELTSRACARGRAYRQRVYAADRLEYPLKRLGKRGEGKFQRISWDEALDTVAAELKRVKAAYGPAAITFVGSGGDISWLHNADLVRRLLTRFGGYSDTWGLHSCEAAFFASMASYGALATHGTRDNLMASRLIICWGWNPSDTRFYDNTPLQLARAREEGARIICIDPRFSNSAATYADQWIPVIPGTDTAMLLAMAQVILAEGLEDGAFLARHTSGFEKFRDYVLGTADGCPKTPAWAEAITGVPASTITALARVYAAAKPAALFDGIGVGRAAYGEQFHRAVVALAAMTGNIGVRGGHTPASYSSARTPGISLGAVAGARMAGGANPVDGTLPPRVLGDWNSRGASSARVHFTGLAEAILEGRPGGQRGHDLQVGT